MIAKLKLLAAVLVFVDCTKNGDDLFLGRERDRTGNLGAVALCDFDDLCRRSIDQRVVVALKTDSDILYH